MGGSWRLGASTHQSDRTFIATAMSTAMNVRTPHCSPAKALTHCEVQNGAPITKIFNKRRGQRSFQICSSIHVCTGRVSDVVLSAVNRSV